MKKVEQDSPQMPLSWDEQITSVAYYPNNKVHQQAKTFVASFSDSPEKYATFSIELLYKAVDAHLMSFIQKITQSVRKQKA